jgi:hypothetical protein
MELQMQELPGEFVGWPGRVTAKKLAQTKEAAFAATFVPFPYVRAAKLLSWLSCVLPSAFSSDLKCAFWRQRSSGAGRAFHGPLCSRGRARNREEQISPLPTGPVRLPTQK